MVGKTKRPDADEKRRMTVLKENVPCVPCLMLGKRRLPSIQHTVSGMTRDGHLSTYSSCAWHHFGHPLDNWQGLPGADGGGRQATESILGPSFAHGRKPFESFFGSESELVAIASMLIDSFEEYDWIDYDVPSEVRGRVPAIR